MRIFFIYESKIMPRFKRFSDGSFFNSYKDSILNEYNYECIINKTIFSIFSYNNDGRHIGNITDFLMEAGMEMRFCGDEICGDILFFRFSRIQK